MDNKVKLSVIVPVFNVERYLDECISSILLQSFKDLELILVDDGSTDSSLSICNEYKRKDPRVKILHQENGGQIKATFAGYSISSGEYIGFVDSDDYILPGMYEKMMKKAKEDGSDIVACSAYRIHGRKKIILGNNAQEGFYDKKRIEAEILPSLFNNHNLIGMNPGLQPSRCFKVFKRDIVKTGFDTIAIKNIPYGEDLLFTYTCVIKSNSISVLENSDPGYFYRTNPNSISWKYRENLFAKSMNVLLFLSSLDEVKENHTFQKEIDYHICFYSINAFLNEYMMKNRCTNSEKKKHINEIIESPVFQKSAWNINIKEVSQGNRQLLALMRKKKLSAVHAIGILISLLRVPITKISQSLF